MTTSTTTTTASSHRMAFSAIVVIAANTMNGPGLTTLPAVGQSAGIVTFLLLTAISMGVTAFVIHRLCTLIWTHQKLDHRIDGPALEDSDIVALSGEAWKNDSSRRIASIAMVGCALALALAQMMLCAKIADAMIVASFGSACGVSPIPSSGQMMHCTSNLSMQPFTPPVGSVATTNNNNPPMFLITLGLVIASSITVSLASVDQSSMITAQYVLFGCLLLACLRFCHTLSTAANEPSCAEEHPPSFILGPQPFEAVGSILFNFAFVVTAPPLACGAHSMNDAIRALVTAIVIMGLLYSVIGRIGAPAAACSEGGDTNLLSLVLRGRGNWDILSVIVFGLSQLAAIPVYCELARETMDSHIKIVSPRNSFWLCHAAPWVICAVTYNSTLFESFVEWSSLLLLGFANFSLPLFLELELKDYHYHIVPGHNRRVVGQGPDKVLWMCAIVTGGIASVILQRMTESFVLAEIGFMITLSGVLHYYH